MLKNKKYNVHLFNGDFSEEIKFVEVDGKKFIDDGQGKPKLDDKQQPIPFEEKKVDKVDIKIEDADLDALAKVNPHVARVLQEQKERAEKDALKAEEDKKKADEEAGKKGEWQKLADERLQTVETLKKDIKSRDDMLIGYKQTIENILKPVLASIPKDKLSLIPSDFSPRQQLEYVMKNATVLGIAGVVAKGGDVPKNDGKTGTELEVMVTRFEELRKKTGRTMAEDNELLEIAKKLKEAQQKK